MYTNIKFTIILVLQSNFCNCQRLLYLVTLGRQYKYISYLSLSGGLLLIKFYNLHSFIAKGRIKLQFYNHHDSHNITFSSVIHVHIYDELELNCTYSCFILMIISLHTELHKLTHNAILQANIIII